MKNLFTSGWSSIAKSVAFGFAAPYVTPAVDQENDAPLFAAAGFSSVDLPPVIMKPPIKGQRNITLRVHPKTGVAELRAPRRTSRAQLVTFLHEQRPWLQQQLATLAPAIPLQAGVTIPYMGQARQVVADPQHKRGVRDNGQQLLVGVRDALGPAGFDDALAASLLRRRLQAFLQAQAKRELHMRAKYYAGLLQKPVASIAVRDMHARWGSCAQKVGQKVGQKAGAKTGAKGGARLSFNWRLIMAPLFVLDYVAAHECAHLRHMDHSPAFWVQVKDLVGDYQPAEAWLTNHGHSLLRVG